MHIPQGFFTSQKIVSKHHGTWSISPMLVATANYLWQWEHQKLGWIGFAKIPKLGTLENSANTWKHSCIVELLATFSKCKKACIKMFTWKVFGIRILSCLHSWLKFSNLILCLIVHLLPYLLLHIYWCGTFKLE